MQNNQEYSKQIPTEVYVVQDLGKQFTNPISKTTFQALPRIYGKKKKKKYVVKYDFQEKQKLALKPKVYPIHHCVQSNEKLTQQRGITKQIIIDNQVSTRRQKTQIRNQIKQSAEKLSRPRNQICNRRYCFCHKEHLQRFARSQSKQQLKVPRGRSIRLPQISKDFEPDDVESKHKVNTQKENDLQKSKRPFTLLDLLRNNQNSIAPNQYTSIDRNNVGQEEPNSNRSIGVRRHAQSVFVQTQFQLDQQQIDDKKRQHQISEDKEGLQQDNYQEEALLEDEKKNMSVRQKYSSSQNNPLEMKNKQQSPNDQLKKQNHQKKQRESENQSQQSKDKLYELNSKSSSIQQDENRNKILQNRMNQLKQRYQNNQSDSDNDDSRSIASSISSNSISKYVFQKGNKNTIFHALGKQERVQSNQSKSRVKSQKLNKEAGNEKNQKRQKFTYQKKNGLFVIPQQDQYIHYLKDYQPMGQKFKLKQVLKSENFKVIKSDDGIYFGEMINQEKEGKGIMVTQKTIFEGKYSKDIKIQGCQKNIDGIYKGQFQNGVREGYGKFQWYNGQVFEGQWKNGTKNGYGTWKSPKGDFYEGEWRLNRQHGKGIFRHRLSTYRGQFVDFLKNGEGEEIFSNGDRYVGNYKQGKPHGKGKYQWADGSYYQGQFVKGVREGHGIWKYKNGTIYEGQFKNDFKNGKGKQVYKTGQRFEGIFRQGQKHQGILFDSKNNKIEIKNQI